LKFEEKNGYPIHAVSLVEHQTGIVLTQGHVENNDLETKDGHHAVCCVLVELSQERNVRE